MLWVNLLRRLSKEKNFGISMVRFSNVYGLICFLLVDWVGDGVVFYIILGNF